MWTWLLLCCRPVPVALGPDADGDGWRLPLDCDDGNAAVNPGAAEQCGNGLDDDCDLAAPGCGLYGELSLDDGLATGGEVAGGGLGTVLTGGPVPAATAPGVGVLLLHQGTWLPAESPGFGAALASGAGGLLVGDPDSSAVLLWQDAPLRLEGEAGSRAGAAVAWADDTVLVGAPGAGEDGQGAVYLLPSPTADQDLSDAPAIVRGATEGQQVGAAVLGGDLDGDGSLDLVVGSTTTDAEQPWAWLLLGPLHGEWTVADADATLTHWDPADEVALAGPCDIDGDGYPDLLATTWSRNETEWSTSWTYGNLYVRGATLDVVGGWYSSTDQPVRPACGDSNGDGLSEIATRGGGWVTVDSGQWSNVALLDTESDQPLTLAFATGNGHDDLLIGLPASDLLAEGGGAVWRLPGGPGF